MTNKQKKTRVPKTAKSQARLKSDALTKAESAARGVLISCEVSRPDFDSITFAAPDSILGYDIVILDLEASFRHYAALSNEYRGLPWLNDAKSSKVQSDCGRRQRELAELLGAGATVVVLTTPPLHCYIDTGRREYSGTGRNRHTTVMLSDFDFLSNAIPEQIVLELGRGKAVQFTDHPAAVLFRDLEEFLFHEAIVEDMTPLAYIRGTKNTIVGGLKRIGRGHIMVLPKPKEADDSPNGGAWLRRYDRFLTAIQLAHKAISPDLQESLPFWASEVRTDRELAQKDELDKHLASATRAQLSVEEAQSVLRSFERRKLLLTASGKTLEHIVIETLERFGFDVVARDDDRTDLILKYEDRVGVCEVKGLTGSAREKDAAQLEKWVTIYHTETDVEPKGILLVNAFRERPILARHEDPFPKQMLEYVRKKELALLTTSQLFVADVIYDSDPGRVRRFCRGIFDANGLVLADFTDPSEVLHQLSTSTATTT